MRAASTWRKRFPAAPPTFARRWPASWASSWSHPCSSGAPRACTTTRAAVIDAGGELLGRYRKLHVPDDPQYFEKFYFTPGDLGYRVFDTRAGGSAC